MTMLLELINVGDTSVFADDELVERVLMLALLDVLDVVERVLSLLEDVEVVEELVV
jgi:hypothetical protein